MLWLLEDSTIFILSIFLNPPTGHSEGYHPTEFVPSITAPVSVVNFPESDLARPVILVRSRKDCFNISGEGDVVADGDGDGDADVDREVERGIDGSILRAGLHEYPYFPNSSCIS